MIYRRLSPVIALLVMTTMACNQTPNSPITETARPTVVTEVPAFTQVFVTLTNMASSPTTVVRVDTPVSATTIPSPIVVTDIPTAMPIAGVHQVLAGETLSCIGRGYGVLPKAIADASGIELTAILSIGQLLKIPFVQWINIPAGPVCLPQFPTPFPGLPINSPVPQPTLPDPATLTPTNLPFSVTATPTQPSLPEPSLTPTLHFPDTPTSTWLPGPTGLPPGTIGP